MIEIEYVKPEGKNALLLLSTEQRDRLSEVPEDDPGHDLAQAALDGDALRRTLGDVQTAKFDLSEPTWDTKMKVDVLVKRKQRSDPFWKDAHPSELWPLQVGCAYEALPPRVVEGWDGPITEELRDLLAAECAARIFFEPQPDEARADFLNSSPPS
jgi:hypothetical protein